ncbi:MAG: biopolymer transporter ExbD [Pseudomonadota bacterium]
MQFDPPKATASDEQLLPLVDIILMLLIFFMLAGTLVASDPLQVNPPDSASETHVNERELVVVLGQNGELAFDGEVLDRQTFELVLKERVASAPEAQFWLKADAQADSNDVIVVMELLREAGVERLELLTLQKTDQENP